MPDKTWKVLERKIGKLLGGERVKRMGDYAQSATDVIVPDQPHLRIDCKLRRNFVLHGHFRDFRKKTRRTGRQPVLITREKGATAALVNLTAEAYASLLNARREGRRIRFLAERAEIVKHRFRHHALFREIQGRYCLHAEDVPLLVTKEHAKQMYVVTIAAGYFEELLPARRGKILRPRTPSAQS